LTKKLENIQKDSSQCN